MSKRDFSEVENSYDSAVDHGIKKPPPPSTPDGKRWEGGLQMIPFVHRNEPLARSFVSTYTHTEGHTLQDHEHDHERLVTYGPTHTLGAPEGQPRVRQFFVHAAGAAGAFLGGSAGTLVGGEAGMVAGAAGGKDLGERAGGRIYDGVVHVGDRALHALREWIHRQGSAMRDRIVGHAHQLTRDASDLMRQYFSRTVHRVGSRISNIKDAVIHYFGTRGAAYAHTAIRKFQQSRAARGHAGRARLEGRATLAGAIHDLKRTHHGHLQAHHQLYWAHDGHTPFAGGHDNDIWAGMKHYSRKHLKARKKKRKRTSRSKRKA